MSYNYWQQQPSYDNCGGYGGGYGNNSNTFVLIVVLFILLVIVGTIYVN